MINNIFLAFIPLFVAMDAIGLLPIYISLTEDLSKSEKNKALIHSIITASILAVAFIFLGKTIFKLLNITMGDFMIGGGTILFSIAIMDILDLSKRKKGATYSLGAVPLGTPLMVGPGVLTAILLIVPQYGIIPVLISVFLNVLLAALIFRSSGLLLRILGRTGSKAVSKIISLFLAAFAIMLVRKGFESFLK